MIRGLERDGLVNRNIYATIPPKVEYSLTPLGGTLVALLRSIRVWSETHIEQVMSAQENYGSEVEVSSELSLSLKIAHHFGVYIERLVSRPFHHRGIFYDHI